MRPFLMDKTIAVSRYPAATRSICWTDPLAGAIRALDEAAVISEIDRFLAR